MNVQGYSLHLKQSTSHIKNQELPDFMKNKSDNTGITKRPVQNEKNILFDSQKYAESIRAQRQQSSATSLKLKKLKYQFKDISAKILRSKTSASARMVAGQAKRELLRLKREKQNNNDGGAELDAAINHAKAMERVAKKKVKHLEQEEMLQASSGVFIEEEICKPEEEILYEYEEEMTESTELEDCLYELEEKMHDLLEDMGLEELEDSLLMTKSEMEPEDIKALKSKHRNREMRDIVRADTEYLKAIFEGYEKAKSGEAGTTPVAQDTFTSTTMPVPAINIIV